MKFNINSLIQNTTQEATIEPRDIFKLLPKKDRKYSYLRDVQAEVLKQWFDRRNEDEIVIKMNTGSGKTVVSLLILQSYLSQNEGPAVYIVPDNYLLSQVENEALLLGIKTTTNPRDLTYLRQKSILLINIHKLFNGYSVFGIGDEGIKIEIGTVLIDDAHACIDKLEDQFTMSVKLDNPKYAQIFSLFERDLMQQSITKTSDIKINTPGSSMQVPFWSMQNKFTEVIGILTENLSEDENEEIKWKLPLLKHYFQFCDCIITNRMIEFSIRVIPTEIISSYNNARKIITSATLPDDTILQKYLGISKTSILNSITPSSASDLGERLIIIPEEINPKIEKGEIKSLLVKYSLSYKVVIIVPSFYRSEYWSDIADDILVADNIIDGLEKFKAQDKGLIVLINKYDGIDLPNDDCRILVIDELPEDRSEIEKIDTNILSSFNLSLLRKIRKIEQGMGRAIRSNEDYSVVFLLGRSLTNYLFTKNGFQYFTPATRRQIEISSSLLEQINNGSIDDLKEATDLVLNRDEDWINTIKSSLLGLGFEPQIPNEIAFSFRKAYQQAWVEQYNDSVSIMEECANNNREKPINGWIKYYIAMFQNFVDKSSAQMTLKSGLSKNSKIVRPIEGIQYQKISHASDQADKCKTYLNNYIEKPNNILIALNSILDDLIFKPETSAKFESAIKEIGTALGFVSQRPENETGRGPDNLWCCGDLTFCVIECKNGCTSKLINKHDTNQINGSINWFTGVYDETCKYTPILIHPRLEFEHAASPHKDLRIMDSDKLEYFKKSVQSFFVSVVKTGQVAELDQIRILLRDNKLLTQQIIHEYTKSI